MLDMTFISIPSGSSAARSSGRAVRMYPFSHRFWDGSIRICKRCIPCASCILRISASSGTIAGPGRAKLSSLNSSRVTAAPISSADSSPKQRQFTTGRAKVLTNVVITTRTQRPRAPKIRSTVGKHNQHTELCACKGLDTLALGTIIIFSVSECIVVVVDVSIRSIAFALWLVFVDGLI